MSNFKYQTWRSLLLKGVTFSNTQDFDIYEFGVCSGKSVKEFLHYIPNSKFNKIYGFDSFEGLPFDDTEPLWQECWSKGNFDSRKETSTDSPEAASKVIENFINNENYIPIIGYYNNVLNDDLLKKYNFKKALIVDVDVDLYSSAYTVLDFIFKNKLYQNGVTTIFYDDWGGSIGFENHSSGESRAHKELTEKYNIKTEEIFSIGNEFPHVHKVFKIL
jgi:hypothetical protein